MSAAFILIGGKTGDLIGRKLAYVLGLLGYAVGAIAMTVAQGLTAIIIFWAVIGGIGASLLLPAMQSLIHGNFEGAHQKRVYALVGASAAIAAAVGPLLGGFITTFLSWRVGFAAGGRDHRGRALGHLPGEGRAVRGVARGRLGRAGLSVVGMGGVVLGILVWQEGGESVGLLIGLGRGRARRLRVVAARPQAARPGHAGRPGALPLQAVPDGCERSAAAAGRPRRHHDRAADLPADGARVQRPARGHLDRPVVAEHVRRSRCSPGDGRKGRPSSVILLGFRRAGRAGSCCSSSSCRAPSSGWWLAIPLVVAGCGLGLLVSQLNNYTLSPISDERVSEAAGVNSAAGSFGLSFGLAFAGAIMLATLSIAFTSRAESSTVLSPDRAAAGRHGPGGRRRDHVRRPPQGGAGRSAGGRAGRDRGDQHRRPARSRCRWRC